MVVCKNEQSRHSKSKWDAELPELVNGDRAAAMHGPDYDGAFSSSSRCS
jgi:hypothetical protein